MTDVMDTFGTFTKDDAKATSEQMSTGADWIRFEKGVTVIVRILPPLADEKLPWELIHQHFIKMPGQTKATAFNCPRHMRNERCPACEKHDRLTATGNAHDEALAKEFRANFRAIARAIDRDKMDAGVRPVGLPSTVMKRLTHFREKLNKDFVHPVTGCDIAVEFLGASPWYNVDLLDPSPIAQRQEGFADVVNQMRNLPLKPFAKVLSFDEIVAKLSGQEPAQHRAVHSPASSQPQRAAIGSSVGAVDDSSDPF